MTAEQIKRMTRGQLIEAMWNAMAIGIAGLKVNDQRMTDYAIDIAGALERELGRMGGGRRDRLVSVQIKRRWPGAYGRYIQRRNRGTAERSDRVAAEYERLRETEI